jgi:O-antigen/teichoic acid export membrane protein
MTTSKFNLVKNIRFSVIGFIINIFLVFISYKLVIINGGLEDVGLWATLMAWTQLIRIGDVGMANASIRFVSMKDASTPEDLLRIYSYIDTGVLTNIVFFLLLSIAGYLVMDTFLPNLIEEASIELANELLPIMFLIFFLMNISGVLLGSLQGLHYGYISAQLGVLGNVIQLCLVVLFVPKFGLIGLGYAMLIQYLILNFLTWIIIWKKLEMKPFMPLNFSIFTLKEMLGFSLKAQVANISNGLFEPVSKILVSFFGGLQAQGLYELAYKTVSLSRNAITAGLMATLPTTTRTIVYNHTLAKKLYKKTLAKVTFITIALLALVVLAAPLISNIWIGDFNNDYWLFVLIIAIGFLFNTIGAPAYNLGLAYGVMKYNIGVSILTLLLLLSFGYKLGEMYGYLGVLLTVCISMIIGGLLIKFYNERLLEKDYILK